MFPARSFYAGSGRPPVQVGTWQQLCAAVDAGVLAENQWVEHKQDIPAGTKAAGELAKDLASLSVEGGVFIVGAIDKISDVSGLVGVEDPDGLRERIGQVASNRIKPALNVVIDILRAEKEQDGAPRRPCLLVTVHASASAPHMVDDRYWGRSATGKRPLGDSEVRRLIAERAARAEDLSQQLLAMSENFDPVPVDERRFGHIYFYARPAMPPMTRVTEVLAPVHPAQWVREHLPGRAAYSRTLQELLDRQIPHADGLMVASVLRSEKSDDAEACAMQLLLEDDGGLRLTSCQGTREWPETTQACISPHYHLELAHQVVSMAAAVLRNHAGYFGSWDIGVHVTGLEGCPSTVAMQADFRLSSTVFQTPTYTSLTDASTEEMLERTSAVVERLYARFTRGLGLDNFFFPYTQFGDIASKSAR